MVPHEKVTLRPCAPGEAGVAQKGLVRFRSVGKRRHPIEIHIQQQSVEGGEIELTDVVPAPFKNQNLITIIGNCESYGKSQSFSKPISRYSFSYFTETIQAFQGGCSAWHGPDAADVVHFAVNLRGLVRSRDRRGAHIHPLARPAHTHAIKLVISYCKSQWCMDVHGCQWMAACT